MRFFGGGCFNSVHTRCIVKTSVGDWFFTTTGADVPGVQHWQKTVLVIIFLENTREFPEIITSTGAKFWLRFCLSALALVTSKSPKVDLQGVFVIVLLNLKVSCGIPREQALLRK